MATKMAKTKKLKSHQWAKKRIKVTKTGKVLFDKIWNNHLLTNKGKNNKAHPHGKALWKTDQKKMKALSPYS